MKNEKGMTFLTLAIAVVIIIVLIGVIIFFVMQSYKKEEFDGTRTDMLSIQGKIKVLSESAVAKKDETLKKGTKLSESEEDEKIKSILEKGIISKEEENYEQYYRLNSENLAELGLSSIELKDGEYVIVNYKTYEVIYTQGIKIKEEEYFKLSELDKIKEEKEIELNEQATEKEKDETKQEEQPESEAPNQEPQPEQPASETQTQESQPEQPTPEAPTQEQ